MCSNICELRKLFSVWLNDLDWMFEAVELHGNVLVNPKKKKSTNSVFGRSGVAFKSRWLRADANFSFTKTSC